jgi:hypothetical protein
MYEIYFSFQIFLILFTDIVLIAEQDIPNNFIIVEEPIYLTDIVFQDFSRPNGEILPHFV